MKLTIQIFGTALLRIGNAVKGFVSEVKALASEDQVQAIAAEFPGGTQIDAACIALCNDALGVINALPAMLAGKESAIDAIYTKLAADIARVKHNNSKHGIGYYFQLIGAVLEDVAEAV